MAIENKYRVHEVAKDFGASTKEITEILTKYCTTPKNHMQVLGDQELSVIFEYMTQQHPVADIEKVLNQQAATVRPAQQGKTEKNEKSDKGAKPAKEQGAPQGENKSEKAEKPAQIGRAHV